MLKSFRPSSIRQAEVGWKALKFGLPDSLTTLPKAEVLTFLVSLEGKVASNTILAYRNPLKTP